MKIFTKKINKIILPIVLAFSMFGAIGAGTTLTASAASSSTLDNELFTGGGGTSATTSTYSMQFNYTITTTTGGGGGTNTTYSNGVGYSVGVQTTQSSTYTATLSLTSASYVSGSSMPIGSYVTSGNVSLAINSSISQGTIKVTNASGTQVGSGNKTLSLSGLSDGRYNVEVYFGGGAWATSARSGTSKTTSGTTSFIVDSTAPSVTGGSTSTTGKYTNSAFSISSSDSTSGVKTLYYKIPGSTTWSTDNYYYKSIPAGSTNGLYSFYAVDNAGNSTSVYYVNYDDTKPTGTVKNLSGTTISGYTNSSFYYTATDNASGISYCLYLKPNSSTWETYTSGTTIDYLSTNGTYSFRSVDKCGNVSDTTSITLDTALPVITLYSGNSVVSSGKKTTAANIKAVASDSTSGVKTVYVKTPGASAYSVYTSGTTMSTNGTYYFYAVDNAGNTSSTVNISLDNIKPTITSSVGSNGSKVSQAFTITATDNIGTPTFYYKLAGNESYTLCSTNSITIPSTYANGIYYFFASDSFGNTSDTFSINLSIDAPSAQIIKPSNGNIACVVWSESGCSATLNGNYYSSGTWITTEGDYTFVLTNAANRSTTLNFSVDHYYVAGNKVNPTCTNKGYTIYKCQNCNDTYNADYVNALGHSYSTSVVQPTCSEKGYTVHTCSRCGYSYNDTYTDLLGHTYGGWFVVTSPTCTTSGTSRRNCTDCDYYETRTDNALGHDYSTVKVGATCTAQGYTVHTCSRCKASYNDSYVAVLGHDYKDAVTKPTCTDRGFTTHTCSRCNASYVDSYTDSLGHSFGSWYTTKAATCVDTGTARRDCSRCSYYETKVVSPLGHDYKSNTTSPTCLERGFTTHTCSRCKDAYIDSWVTALGHSYKDEVVAPTCMEEGYTLHKCIRCDDSYKTDTVSKLGHNYIENYIPATCDESGYLMHTCLRCGDEYKSDIVNPAGHDYETRVTLLSSCADDGERAFHCSKCGEMHYEKIPARGHQYTIVDAEHSDGKVYRTYTCSTCGYSYDSMIGEEYEQISNYVEYLFEEYSPYMMYVFLATAGVWSIAMGVALIIAKKNEDQAKAKKMIANYIIGLVAIFIILVAAPYLVRGIAFLVS